MISVLFVCLGNICRSPMAEAVFRKMTADAGLSGAIKTDSCGTSGWHTGSPPHAGTIRVLKAHETPCGGIYAAVLAHKHFTFDYIIAMDEQNLKDIRSFGSGEENTEIRLLSSFAEGSKWVSVPDPWITGDFEQTYTLICEGCSGLLEYIAKKHNLSLKLNK